MIWVDYVIIAVIALSAVIGLARGLIREVLSLAIWVAAGAVACELRTCFRSVPALQHAINHVFSQVMDGNADAAQAATPFRGYGCGDVCKDVRLIRIGRGAAKRCVFAGGERGQECAGC